LPLFRSRTLLLLGRVTPAPGAVHVVIGLADLPVGFVLAVFGIRNVVHDVRYSVVQVVEHVRGTGRKDNGRSVIVLPHVVGTPLLGATLIRTMLVRAPLFGTSFVGTSFLRPTVQALCNVFGLRGQSSLRR
jgi:hypothetical protein